MLRGDYHGHPYGEINLVVPLDEGAQSTGLQGWQGAGWTAPDPGSRHYPEVRGGAVNALFYLPLVEFRTIFRLPPDAKSPHPKATALSPGVTRSQTLTEDDLVAVANDLGPTHEVGKEIEAATRGKGTDRFLNARHANGDGTTSTDINPCQERRSNSGATLCGAVQSRGYRSRTLPARTRAGSAGWAPPHGARRLCARVLDGVHRRVSADRRVAEIAR